MNDAQIRAAVRKRQRDAGCFEHLHRLAQRQDRLAVAVLVFDELLDLPQCRQLDLRCRAARQHHGIPEDRRSGLGCDLDVNRLAGFRLHDPKAGADEPGRGPGIHQRLVCGAERHAVDTVAHE